MIKKKHYSKGGNFDSYEKLKQTADEAVIPFTSRLYCLSYIAGYIVTTAPGDNYLWQKEKGVWAMKGIICNREFTVSALKTSQAVVLMC